MRDAGELARRGEVDATAPPRRSSKYQLSTSDAADAGLGMGDA